MKIAIVEDEKEHADLLISYLEKWASESRHELFLKQYESAEAFLFSWEEEKDFSAVFLDIQMGKMNGMELARQIRKDNRTVGIIFTTGIADYMQEGYEVLALHYLIKPLSPEKVMQCMDRVMSREREEQPCLCLKFETGVERVEMDRIWWVSALGHNVLVCIENAKGQTIRREALSSIGELEDMLLKRNSFFKCHRSYLINFIHVRRIEKSDVIMDNGDKIPLSRRLYKEVNEGFIEYYTAERGRK